MSNNGEAFILNDRAPALANYPHMRKAGGFLWVSGLSSRRLDGKHEGVTYDEEGRVVGKDIKGQTRACIENMKVILEAAGADLSHVVDLQVFLINMEDYNGMNQVYNEYFDGQTGPTRTTVAVHQLPHPNLLIEIKAVALCPTQQ